MIRTVEIADHLLTPNKPQPYELIGPWEMLKKSERLIFEHNFRIDAESHSYEIAHWRIQWNSCNEKLILVQVLAWCS